MKKQLLLADFFSYRDFNACEMRAHYFTKYYKMTF